MIRLGQVEHLSYRKVIQLLKEIIEHPRTDTGKPERIKGQIKEIWSIRITQKHRLVYSICEDDFKIEILSVWGHYGDK